MCAFFANLLNVPTEPAPKKFNDPVFLIGIMRSGTTLLMNTLSEHPQLLKVGFEINKVWTEIGGAPCSTHCVERTEEHFEPIYSNNMTSYLSRYEENSKSFLRHLSRLSQKRFYGSGRVSYDWENLILMNKSPHLSNKIRYLNRMYPNAKFIVIVRSPFGQCASMKVHFNSYHKKDNYHFHLPENDNSCWTNLKNPDLSKWNAERLFPNNFSLLPEAWVRLNNSIFSHLESVEKSRKVVISYEALMNERENSLQEIFDFLSLEKKHDSVVKKIIAKERKIHNTSTKGDPLKKWKKHLKEEEQAAVTQLLKQHEAAYQFILKNVPNSASYWGVD